MKYATFVALLILASQSVADSLTANLQRIESDWASIYYMTPKNQKANAYLKLLGEAERLSANLPNRAEPIFWQAVIKATMADHLDAIGAINSVKEAHDLLLTAIQIDPNTMDGSAYVTLGTLYYMTPKWPIAFGDDNKAKQMLETGLKINPKGIDANYFYGDFLLSKGQTSKAIEYFKKAIDAPARKEQLFADNQLKTEASIALNKALKQQGNDHKGMFLSLFSPSSIN
jgi:tetratricopeptide (TPR) repeat protein